MYHHFNERSGLKAPLIADDVYELIMKVSFLIPARLCAVRSIDCNAQFKFANVLIYVAFFRL